MSAASPTPSPRRHFVFVHGASHGAWCWYKVRSLLEVAGHEVTCLDLKGAGIDRTDPNTVFTMEAYNQPLSHFLSHLKDDQKVILVGHSVGGASVTDALCKFPDKIAMAIYLAASMQNPKDHPIIAKHESKGVSKEKKAGADDIFELIYGQGTDQEPTGVIMKKHYQGLKYYNKSPLEDSTLASMLLRPAPYRALKGSEEFAEAPQEVESVPRVFLKTLEDHMFDLGRQEAMIALWPPSQVHCLDSDHSAFFSNPSGVFDCLIKAATSIN